MGLMLVCIDYVWFGYIVDMIDFVVDELCDYLVCVCVQGVIGLKVLGGYFFLIVEVMVWVIVVCVENGVYVVFYVGMLDILQDMCGLCQVLDFVVGYLLYLLYVNVYVCGSQDYILIEMMEVCCLIEVYFNIWLESYLVFFNGNFVKCVNGIFESVVMQCNLVKGGYVVILQGMEDVIFGGWVYVYMLQDGENLLVIGEVVLVVWCVVDSDIGCSFYVNLFEVCINLVIMKCVSGCFVIDVLVIDGGGIFCNDLCECGFVLVVLNVLMLGEFVVKILVEFVWMMGLFGKGYLGIGVDGDIMLVDLVWCQVVFSFGGGCLILCDGVVVGWGVMILFLFEVEQYLCDKGL